MNRKSILIVLSIVSYLTLAFLTACSRRGDSYVGAHWVERDSSLVYVTEWWVSGGGLTGSSGSGGIEAFSLSLTPGGHKVPKRIVSLDGNFDFCDQLIYRPTDSLFLIAYALEGDCASGRKMRAGSLQDGNFMESSPLDTSLLLNLLNVDGIAFDSGFYVEQELEYDKLCIVGRGCITP